VNDVVALGEKAGVLKRMMMTRRGRERENPNVRRRRHVFRQ
jgi:hypothetical protein